MVFAVVDVGIFGSVVIVKLAANPEGCEGAASGNPASSCKARALIAGLCKHGQMNGGESLRWGTLAESQEVPARGLSPEVWAVIGERTLDRAVIEMLAELEQKTGSKVLVIDLEEKLSVLGNTALSKAEYDRQLRVWATAHLQHELRKERATVAAASDFEYLEDAPGGNSIANRLERKRQRMCDNLIKSARTEVTKLFKLHPSLDVFPKVATAIRLAAETWDLPEFNEIRRNHEQLSLHYADLTRALDQRQEIWLDRAQQILELQKAMFEEDAKPARPKKFTNVLECIRYSKYELSVHWIDTRWDKLQLQHLKPTKCKALYDAHFESGALLIENYPQSFDSALTDMEACLQHPLAVTTRTPILLGWAIATAAEPSVDAIHERLNRAEDIRSRLLVAVEYRIASDSFIKSVGDDGSASKLEFARQSDDETSGLLRTGYEPAEDVPVLEEPKKGERDARRTAQESMWLEAIRSSAEQMAREEIVRGIHVLSDLRFQATGNALVNRARKRIINEVALPVTKTKPAVPKPPREESRESTKNHRRRMDPVLTDTSNWPHVKQAFERSQVVLRTAVVDFPMDSGGNTLPLLAPGSRDYRYIAASILSLWVWLVESLPGQTLHDRITKISEAVIEMSPSSQGANDPIFQSLALTVASEQLVIDRSSGLAVVPDSTKTALKNLRDHVDSFMSAPEHSEDSQ
jgi:hypothetical protein